MALKSHLNSSDDKSSMLPRGLNLLFVGFFMVFTGVIILVVVAVLSGGSGDFGVVIFIGPIPIVIGAGPRPEWIVLFTIILGVLTTLLFVLFRRKVRRVKVQP